MRFYGLIILYLLLVLAVYITGISSWWYVFASLVFIGAIFAGVCIMSLNIFVKSQTKLEHPGNAVAFTFDDGPDAELTPQVLDLLEGYNAKATFFCIGNKLEKYPEIAQRIINEGHKIGNHTYEHANTFPIWSIGKIRQSIERTDVVIEKLSGEKSSLFRPPYGVTNNLIAMALKPFNKRIIGWNIRTLDTCKSAEVVINTVQKKFKPGSIVLFHDTNPNIVSELKAALELCQQKNLKTVTL